MVNNMAEEEKRQRLLGYLVFNTRRARMHITRAGVMEGGRDSEQGRK